MNESNPSKIVFPCDYPIKVVGDTRAEFFDEVFDIVSKHDPTLTMEKVFQRTSRNGNFISISFMLWAKSQEQLKVLFVDLKGLEAVRMVL